MASILNAQYHLNRNLIIKGQVTMNDYYHMLGLPTSTSGDVVGWGDEFLDSGALWIDFDNFESVSDDGLEVTVISFKDEPDLLTDYNYF